MDPKTGEIPEGIEAQTGQALRNVSAVLEAAGLSMSDVVKATVFLKDMNMFSDMNGVYSTFFKGTSFKKRGRSCPPPEGCFD